MQALGSDDDAIRTSAIDALASSGKKAGPRLLAELESQTASLRARTGVIEVLGRMKKAGTALLEDEIMQPVGAGSINKIMSTLGAIQASGPSAGWTSPSLVELIERKPDRAFGEIHMLVRASAIMALGAQGPNTPAVTAVLKKQLREENPGVRLSSACALWWTGSEASVVYPVLVEGLKATNTVALERAIFGLGEMGAQALDAVDDLEGLRDQVSEETRTVIVDALAKIGGHRPPAGPRKK